MSVTLCQRSDDILCCLLLCQYLCCQISSVNLYCLLCPYHSWALKGLSVTCGIGLTAMTE